MIEYNVVKSERKTDFIIQKRAKKSVSNDSHGPALVSPIKIIKVTDRYNPLSTFESNPSSIVSNNIHNLLSTKQLEPVQVHSIVLTVGREKKLSQSTSVKTKISSSPLIDELR